MFTLLKNIHDRSEQLSGKKVLILFLATFLICVPLGIVIGNAIKPKLNESEIPTGTGAIQVPKTSSYEGKIEYVNPAFYPGDNISFSLVDSNGKQIILLSSKDQKLNIAEGLFVKVLGLPAKTKDGKSDVLNVSEVIIKNATN